MSDGLAPRVRADLDHSGLARLWDRAKDRLRRNGLQVRGRLRIEDPTQDERDALAFLMARRFTTAAVTIGLADLDERLRSSAAQRGLVEVVRELRGEIADRPAELRRERERRSRLHDSAAESLTRLDGAPWAQAWSREILSSGALTRIEAEQAARLFDQAVMVLELTPRFAPAESLDTIGRGELAERVTGTAHGLDDATVLARLVQRGLARALDHPVPGSAVERRALWAAAGVSTDSVSSTVLTYGLRPAGEGWAARQLRERSQQGAETHLSLRDLRRLCWSPSLGPAVYVCENPRVVEAAAEAGVNVPLVSTSGNATTVVHTLLAELTAAGARLHCRGDFDWPGLAMVNRLMRHYPATPWRMSATDYEEHVERARARDTPLHSLDGQSQEASWDPELAAAMAAIGFAVHEESALDLLLTDLQ